MMNQPNLSKAEWQTLKQLMEDKNFVKPAEKGHAIVIWDMESYLKECTMYNISTGKVQLAD